MRLICVEEHTVDQAITEAARPTMERDAPYVRLQNATTAPHNELRPSMRPMPEALRLAADLGEGRIRQMDEHGIDMQIVSYSSPAQLAPVALAQAANDRLATTVATNPTHLRGFATLP